jgi:hypothetical protein
MLGLGKIPRGLEESWLMLSTVKLQGDDFPNGREKSEFGTIPTRLHCVESATPSRRAQKGDNCYGIACFSQ